MRLEFDKKIFNAGYGLVYTVLQYVFSLGFLAAILIVMLSALLQIKLTMPDAILPIVIAYLFVALIGFPLASILKCGARRLLWESELELNPDTIIYSKMVDKLWTAAGRMVGHHVYIASEVISVKSSKFSYTISGKIELTVLHNGKVLKHETVSSMKIPKAYKNMERMMTYGR